MRRSTSIQSLAICQVFAMSAAPFGYPAVLNIESLIGHDLRARRSSFWKVQKATSRDDFSISYWPTYRCHMIIGLGSTRRHGQRALESCTRFIGRIKLCLKWYAGRNFTLHLHSAYHWKSAVVCFVPVDVIDPFLPEIRVPLGPHADCTVQGKSSSSITRC